MTVLVLMLTNVPHRVPVMSMPHVPIQTVASPVHVIQVILATVFSATISTSASPIPVMFWQHAQMLKLDIVAHVRLATLLPTVEPHATKLTSALTQI